VNYRDRWGVVHEFKRSWSIRVEVPIMVCEDHSPWWLYPAAGHEDRELLETSELVNCVWCVARGGPRGQ
jgi:hypothetical protein